MNEPSSQDDDQREFVTSDAEIAAAPAPYPLPPAPSSLVTRREAALAMHDRLRQCRRCHIAGYLDERVSVPLARDPKPGWEVPPILLVGQSPGLRATREMKPFAGLTGHKLRSWFEMAGLSEEQYWRKIYFAAVTKCYPGRLPGAKGDRVPTREEQLLCRPWLDAQIAILDPPILVLVGQLAIGTFLGKGSLNKFVGSGFGWNGRRLLPLPHPSGVSTWLNDPANERLVERAMDVLGGWLRELEGERTRSWDDLIAAPAY